MHGSSIILPLLPLAAAQVSQVVQIPPPPAVLLTTTKSGVIPFLPSGTPFGGADTLEGAIISALPPQPGYIGLYGTATAQTNQPAATYRATLTGAMFDPVVGTQIKGYIEGVGTSNGTRFRIQLTGLPDQSQYGPFPYHIHNLPVPADGNCTSTLGHLDPTNRGEYVQCDATQPQTCQVGDLAGKHGGKIMARGNFSANYVDAYLSTTPGNAAFFGGLGFVIHSSNTTRLACANFVLVGGGNGTNGTSGGGSGTGNGNSTSGGGGSGSGNGTGPLSPSTTGPAPGVYTGAAVKTNLAAGAVAIGLLAVLF